MAAIAQSFILTERRTKTARLIGTGAGPARVAASAATAGRASAGCRFSEASLALRVAHGEGRILLLQLRARACGTVRLGAAAIHQRFKAVFAVLAKVLEDGHDTTLPGSNPCET